MGYSVFVHVRLFVLYLISTLNLCAVSVMFLLSLPGYVLVLLHASTAAARGGALCGLGGSVIVYTVSILGGLL